MRAGTSPDEEPSWLADAMLVDVDALRPPDDLSHITDKLGVGNKAELTRAALLGRFVGELSARRPAEGRASVGRVAYG